MDNLALKSLESPSTRTPQTSKRPNDVPGVLCVQSTMPLLSDPRQLPFLRTVTGMASLAVNNAREAQSKRHAMLQLTESLGLFSFAAEALSQGGSTTQLCSLLEERSSSSLVLLDDAGAIVYGGRKPTEYGLSDDKRVELVDTRVSGLVELREERTLDTLGGAVFSSMKRCAP